MRLLRRNFVGAVFAGLGLRPPTPPKPKAGDIPMRPFGKTGVRLTVIGQGGARLALLRDYERGAAHVRHALDLGINYFDNARSYWDGRTEEVYGLVLPAVRKDVFITSKSTKRTRKEAEEDLNASLRALKTDYLDLWQIHAVQTSNDVERLFSPGGGFEAFEAAKKAGKCRFIGFTGHFDPEVLVQMLDRYDKWDSILMPLHAADPAYKSFEEKVLPNAVQRGIGIQAMKVFGNAALLRVLNSEECLDYSLSLPVHCAPVGCSTIGQLDDDARTATKLRQPLPPDQMERLRQLAAGQGQSILKGPDLEYWKRPSS